MVTVTLKIMRATVAVVLLLSIITGQAWAGIFYNVTDLGTLGGVSSVARGISEQGQVTGQSYTANGDQHAFLWDGVMHDIDGRIGGSSNGFGINSNGVVVGHHNTAAGTRAFLYDGAIHDLGTLDGQNSISIAFAINESRVVTGYYTIHGAPSGLRNQAFLYDGTMQTIQGSLEGGDGIARAINADGVVAGQSRTESGRLHAAKRDSTGWHDLGTLGGHSGDALGMNDIGQIVGASETDHELKHAFLWDGQMHDLGTLGGTSSYAYDINNSGQVVGFAEISGGPSRAFVYSNAVMTDLNSLISPSSGWTLTDAYGINDNGQIVGTGTNPLGQQHAFLLTPGTPVPEPSSLVIFATGGIVLAGWSWRRRRCNKEFRPV